VGRGHLSTPIVRAPIITPSHLGQHGYSSKSSSSGKSSSTDDEKKIKDLWVTVSLSIIPLGVGISTSRYIAACKKVLDKSKLTHNLHSDGTNIEGNWDDVMRAVKECHFEMHGMGVLRIHT